MNHLPFFCSNVQHLSGQWCLNPIVFPQWFLAIAIWLFKYCLLWILAAEKDWNSWKEEEKNTSILFSLATVSWVLFSCHSADASPLRWGGHVGNDKVCSRWLTPPTLPITVLWTNHHGCISVKLQRCQI